MESIEYSERCLFHCLRCQHQSWWVAWSRPRLWRTCCRAPSRASPREHRNDCWLIPPCSAYFTLYRSFHQLSHPYDSGKLTYIGNFRQTIKPSPATFNPEFVTCPWFYIIYCHWYNDASNSLYFLALMNTLGVSLRPFCIWAGSNPLGCFWFGILADSRLRELLDWSIAM